MQVQTAIYSKLENCNGHIWTVYTMGL